MSNQYIIYNLIFMQKYKEPEAEVKLKTFLHSKSQKFI